jgi:thiosulfate/3-mercaptopyruvate sulfurtransferase
MILTALVDTGVLARRLSDPEWIIFDCRHELADPARGRAEYAQSHIPGARFLDLDGDLSAPRTGKNGRHPLPDPEELSRRLGQAGVDSRKQVVAYDAQGGMVAARLWWLLRWLGHTQVAVLDGGLAAWERAGLPLSTESVRRTPRRFTARPDPRLLATGNEVAAAALSGALRRGQQLLVDARSADRFAGENETIDPVAGHIPDARNHPFAGNLDTQGRFHEVGQLRRAWEKTLRGVSPQQLIAMCGSGVTACHNLLALEIAGLPGARLYAGSWSEWITDPAHPVARGPDDQLK